MEQPMNYALRRRLRLIDFLLERYWSVGRAELEDYFGIASAQATRDFVSYAKAAPGNALFSQSSKRWVKSDTFKRVFY